MPRPKAQNKHIFIKGVAAACLLACCSIAYGDNLPSVLRHTLGSNPQYFAAIANESANQHAVREAQGGYLPHVTVSAGIGREKTASPASRAASGSSRVWLRREELALRARQLLFGGGRVYKDVQARQFDYTAARFQTHDVREELILRTTEAYLDVLRYREEVKVAMSNVKVHQETLDKAQAKFEGGAGRRVDVQLGVSRLEKAKAQLDNFKGDLQAAVANYTALTDLVPSRYMAMPALKKKWIPNSLARAIHLTLERNPELRIAQSEYLSRDARVGLAASRFWPRVGIELGASENANVDGIEGNNRDFSGMVTFDYDLYRGGSDVANYCASKEDRRRSLRECQQVRRKLIDEVKTAWARLMSTRDELVSLKAHVDATRKVVADYKEQFAIGARPLFNVLDSENDYFNAQIAYITANYNHADAYFQILRSTGRITAVLLGGLRCA